MKLLKRMIKEEWRMHSSLFGNVKFALFPLLIALLSLAIFSAFPYLRFNPADIQLGMHYLLLFFGLSVGSIGFVSESGVKNLLGEINLLLFSSRTLPLSKTRIFATFLLKDILYYFGYFILPFAAGSLAIDPSSLPLLLVSYTLAFLLGLSLTFGLSALYTRTGKLTTAGIVALVALTLHSQQLTFAHLNPAYLFYLAPSWTSLSITLATASLMTVGGTILFKHPVNRSVRHQKDRFHQYAAKINPLNAKNILDLQRSSGGFGKLLFSFLALIGVYWFIVATFPFGSIFTRSPLLTLATLLGISSLSIYNWLNRFDSAESYFTLPLDEKDILTGKITSYLLIGLPLLIGADIAAAIFYSTPPLQLLHAVAISVFSSIYVLSITVRLTGTEPNILLFDVTVLAKFLLLSGVMLLPFLLTSIFYTANPVVATAVLLVLYLLAGTASYRILTQRVNKK